MLKCAFTISIKISFFELIIYPLFTQLLVFATYVH